VYKKKEKNMNHTTKYLVNKIWSNGDIYMYNNLPYKYTYSTTKYGQFSYKHEVDGHDLVRQISVGHGTMLKTTPINSSR
jgi:hypothetical protein